jgi:hypothetical protein
VSANALIWVVFLVFAVRVDPAEFQRIAAERARRDAHQGMDLMSHTSIVVVGRWVGTYGSWNFADRLLTLAAGPAIYFSRLLIVPIDYFGIDGNTKNESLGIAASGFLLSTAFWAAIGEVTTAFAKPRAARYKRGIDNPPST